MFIYKLYVIKYLFVFVELSVSKISQHPWKDVAILIKKSILFYQILLLIFNYLFKAII